jgi:predicted transcriptional regulator of viral defense system
MSATKPTEFLKLKRVARHKELASLVRHPFEIQRLADAGNINALGGGFYCHPEVDPIKAGYVVVSRFYPKAVVSNISALHMYDLTDQRIDRIDVDIPNTTSIRNELIRAHRVHPKYMDGIVEIDVEGYLVKVYSIERSLCDICKDRGKGEIFFKALKRYMETDRLNINAITTYDKLLGTNVIESVAQEFATE